MLRGSKINKKKKKGQDKAFGRPISEELFLPLKAFQGCCTFQPVGIHVNEVLQKSSAQFHLNESSQPLAQWRQGERPDFRMNSGGCGGLSCLDGRGAGSSPSHGYQCQGPGRLLWPRPDCHVEQAASASFIKHVIRPTHSHWPKRPFLPLRCVPA